MDFEEIYRTYLQDVYRFLLKLCHDEQTAEELTQETFTRAYASIDSFRGTCKFSVWLCQIAKNTWFSYYGRQKKSPPSALADQEILVVSGENPEEDVVDSLTAMELHKILHRIKEPYKEVFMLRVFGELRFKEIAEIFDRQEIWARVTYYRAKEMIQKQTEKGDRKK